jgi:hypothetical protein
MKTFAGQVLRGLDECPPATPWLGRVFDQMRSDLTAAQHFALDLPADELAAFVPEGISHLLAAELPYERFTLSISSSLNGERDLLVLVQHVTGVVDRNGVPARDDSPVSFQIFESHSEVGSWWPLNYTMALGPSGITWGFLDQSVASHVTSEMRDVTRGVYCRCANAVGGFIGALSCRNVTAEISDRASPEAVNAKRERNGKARIFDTHTLVVHVNSNRAGIGSVTGGHASPRQHLRRGHIRRLPGGNIWVQSCVVGDAAKGFLRKDYRIAA